MEKSSEIDINIQQVSDRRMRDFRTIIPESQLKKIVRLTVSTSKKSNDKQALLNYRFTNSSEIKKLNMTYRGKNKPTNILTFCYERKPSIIADIVVCLPIILRESKTQQKTVFNHVCHLLIHGTLHALGLDHCQKSQTEEMENLEIKLLEKLGIKNPYI